MAVRKWLVGVVGFAGGCLPLQMTAEPKTATVASNPFAVPAETGRTGKINFQPADEAMGLYVDGVARKVIAANPQAGLKSTLFATIGNQPRPEIFHTGPNMVYVTDGLVRKCATEAELAAVLALELGKIVSEREAAASPDLRNPERLPPIQVPIGNSGQNASTDLAHQFEMAKYEKERPRARRALARPDPNQLARGYLEKAGFQPSDLDTVQPLLQAAQNNITLERQFTGKITPSSWTP